MIKKAAVLLLAALLLILSACDYSPAANVGTLKCKVFKIGRADCIILRTASHTVVIDTGEEDDGAEIVSYLKEHKITAIDKLIITHYDSDHIGGAAALLDYAEVGEVLVPAYSKGSSTYRRFTAAMEAARIQPTALTRDADVRAGQSPIHRVSAGTDVLSEQRGQRIFVDRRRHARRKSVPVRRRRAHRAAGGVHGARRGDV